MQRDIIDCWCCRLGSITARSRSGSLAQSQTSVELPYTPLTENYTAGLDDARAENDNSTINEGESIPPMTSLRYHYDIIMGSL